MYRCKILYVALVISLSCALANLTSKAPHILYIVSDDLGWADVGYHGSIIKTPNIDALAAEGVKLENYYVQPICTPSRNVFMTGRYPIRTGLQHGVIHPAAAAGLPLKERTIANALKEVGYSTHIVGKWHLGFFERGYTPTNRGFDSHYGYYVGAEDYFNHTRAYNGLPALDWHRNEANVWDESGEYSTHLLTSEAIRIIANHNKSNPLFLYLPYQAVHAPYEVPARYEEPYKNIISDKVRRTYAAMVSCMDEGIGNVTKAFKEYGLWEDTLLIWTSDNGGPVPTQSNWPMRGGKHTLFEGGMKVPAFIRSKNIIKQKRKSYELLHGVDLYPTILKQAGANLKQPLPVDGMDVWQTISEGAPSPRHEILHDLDPVIPMAAIRVGDFKLITGIPCVIGANCFWYYPPGQQQPSTPLPVYSAEVGHPPIWLFNITADPNETNDLHEIFPEKVKQLQARLNWYAAQAVPPQPTTKDDPRANPALHGGAWVPWR